jgi:Uma2 family endonuclease
MSPKFRHEKPSHRLGLIIHALAKAFGFKLATARTTTLREEKAEQGLEPDNCFYIANAPAILNVEDIDLAIHPPPDIAVEVDVSRSSVPKEPIYATIGVPELWRLDKGTVIIRVLSQEGTYVTSSMSRSFPKVKAEDLKTLLDQTAVLDDIDAEDHYRAWAKTLVPSANP